MSVIAKAEELKQRVTLQRPTETNTKGEISVTWTDVAKVWARVKPLAGREYDYAAQVRAEIPHRVWIRYRSDVSANWRLRYNGRSLYLLGPPVNLEESNVYLVMDCADKE